MNIIQAIILGIVQGATEFAPVSSSAHLVLVPWWLGWDTPSLLFDATLHLGTLLAVLLFFRRDLWDIAVAWVNALLQRSEWSAKSRLGWWIILGTIPAALVGATLQNSVESVFASTSVTAALLIVTGVILATAEHFSKRWRDLADILWIDALLIGIAQAVATLPGISRSGATIATGLWRGFNREQAARFSFLLSVPIILGAGLKAVFDLVRHPAVQEATVGAGAPELLLGTLAAVVAGLVVIRYLLKYLQQGTLYPFAVYCWVFGLISLIGTVVWR